MLTVPGWDTAPGLRHGFLDRDESMVAGGGDWSRALGALADRSARAHRPPGARYAGDRRRPRSRANRGGRARDARARSRRRHRDRGLRAGAAAGAIRRRGRGRACRMARRRGRRPRVGTRTGCARRGASPRRTSRSHSGRRSARAATVSVPRSERRSRPAPETLTAAAWTPAGDRLMLDLRAAARLLLEAAGVRAVDHRGTVHALHPAPWHPIVATAPARAASSAFIGWDAAGAA